jgi:hypothetical protein
LVGSPDTRILEKLDIPFIKPEDLRALKEESFTDRHILDSISTGINIGSTPPYQPPPPVYQPPVYPPQLNLR